MIKKLHMVAVLLMASALSVFAQGPELKWVSVQDGLGLEIGERITNTQDGNVVVMAKYNTAPTYLSSSYSTLNLADASANLQKTFYGPADSFGANGNANMSFYKLDVNTGDMMWNLSSNIGNFDGGGYMTATPDNGVLLFLKIRHTSLGRMHKDTLLQLVDKDSTVTTIKWDYPTEYGAAPFRPILVKVSAEGKVEWYKHYDVAYGVYTVGTSTYNYTDNFELGGIATDKSGNIYVTGEYRTSINFGEKAYFNSARNAATWTGDTQDDRGDLFVAKLNPQGEAVWGVTTAGDAILCEHPKGLVVEDDNVYLTGTIQGDGNSVVSFGDKQVTPGEKKSVFAASLTASDGSFNWVKVMNSQNNEGCNKGYAKPMGLNVVNGNVYLFGSFQGDILNGSEVAVANGKKQLHSYILKCNAQDGAYLNGIHVGPFAPAKMDILEIENVTEYGNKVVANGYGLFSQSHTYVMDLNLSEASLKCFTVKESKMGTTQGGVLIGDNLVSLTRLKEKATVPGMNGTYMASGASTPWAIMLTCHNIESLFVLNLIDTKKYDATVDKEVKEICYTRDFTNTNWQALYLPFSLNVADLKDNFTFARINDVHQFDTNNDGVIDETKLEVIILADGETEANVPYLIKAKATGKQTLGAKNVVLKAAAPFQRDMTSWNTSFVINGTYEGVADMSANKYYALSGGALIQANKPGVSLNGYRWYLDVQDRFGAEVAPTQIKLLVLDENGNVTGVEEIEANESNSNVWPANVYNMQGKLVKANANGLQGLPKGVYIVNGKKVVL